MHDSHSRHRVSVKVALLNSVRDKVLMTILPDGGYGLPGGHIEGDESPDDALKRELKEELGLDALMYSNVQRKDFWRVSDGGRVILAYTGYLHDIDAITVDPAEVAAVIWVSSDDIRAKQFSKVYDAYILSVLEA